MHISINTAEEISDLDRQVLGLLAGGSFILAGEPQEFEEPDEEPEPEPEPAPRRTAKKTTAKKPEPEPEEEPEPMAEEGVEEEPEDEAGDDDDQSDEDLLALAVKRATEMVGGGEAAKVREALEAAGASRVRELNADNVRDFFDALD